MGLTVVLCVFHMPLSHCYILKIPPEISEDIKYTLLGIIMSFILGSFTIISKLVVMPQNSAEKSVNSLLVSHSAHTFEFVMPRVHIFALVIFVFWSQK